MHGKPSFPPHGQATIAKSACVQAQSTSLVLQMFVLKGLVLVQEAQVLPPAAAQEVALKAKAQDQLVRRHYE
jgi:hypothetical protein